MCMEQWCIISSHCPRNTTVSRAVRCRFHDVNNQILTNNYSEIHYKWSRGTFYPVMLKFKHISCSYMRVCVSKRCHVLHITLKNQIDPSGDTSCIWCPICHRPVFALVVSYLMTNKTLHNVNTFITIGYLVPSFTGKQSLISR